MGGNAKIWGFCSRVMESGAEITVFSLKVTVYKATIQILSLVYQTISSKPSDLDRNKE